MDTFFSKTKYIDIEIIKNGGWHFTNIKTPEKIYEKLMNFGHHDEFEKSGLNIEKIKKFVNEKKIFFNHFQTCCNLSQFMLLLSELNGNQGEQFRPFSF